MGLRRGAGGIFFQKTHFRMGGDLWELQGKEKPTFLSFFLHCYLWKAATEVSLSVIQRFVNRTKSFLAPRLNCITPAPSRCVFRGSSLELYVSLLLRTVLHASSNRCSFRQEGFAVGVIPTSLSELSSLMCSLLKGLLRWPLTPCATVKLLLTCWLSWMNAEISVPQKNLTFHVFLNQTGKLQFPLNPNSEKRHFRKSQTASLQSFVWVLPTSFYARLKLA